MPAFGAGDGNLPDYLVVDFVEKVDEKREVGGIELLDGLSRDHLFGAEFDDDLAEEDDVKRSRTPLNLPVALDLEKVFYLHEPHDAARLSSRLCLYADSPRQREPECRSDAHVSFLFFRFCIGFAYASDPNGPRR